jgi:hypothetical protein
LLFALSLFRFRESQPKDARQSLRPAAVAACQTTPGIDPFGDMKN